MNCPMTFSDQRSGTERDCIREECAWWVLQSMKSTRARAKGRGPAR